jgi:plasmid stabilization system protein ParE
MPKKYNVTVSALARQMLVDNIDFLWRVSDDAANRLELDFEKVIRRIEDNPFQFPFADTLDISGIPLNTYRKCVMESHYKVLFRVEGDEARIEAVIDSRRENKNLFIIVNS